LCGREAAALSARSWWETCDADAIAYAETIALWNRRASVLRRGGHDSPACACLSARFRALHRVGAIMMPSWRPRQLAAAGKKWPKAADSVANYDLATLAP